MDIDLFLELDYSFLDIGALEDVCINFGALEVLLTYKSYMARKASLIVILDQFKKQNGRHISCLMSNGVILLKMPYISPNIAPRGSECEKQFVGSHGLGIFSRC